MSEHALAVRDTLVAIQAFFDQHGHHVTSAEFPIARGLLDETVTELELHLGNRTEQRATAAGATARSRELTGALHEILLPLYTAHELLVESHAGLPRIGRISRKAKRRALLNDAEVYVTIFEQHRELFVSKAVAVDFAERARAQIAALQESSLVSESARGAKTGSTHGIEEILKRVPKLVHHLSAITRPSFRRHGALAEAWASTQRRLPSTSGKKKLKVGGPIALLPAKAGESTFGVSLETATTAHSEAASDAAPAEPRPAPPSVPERPTAEPPAGAGSADVAKMEAPHDTAATPKPPRRRKRRPGRPRKRAK